MLAHPLNVSPSPLEIIETSSSLLSLQLLRPTDPPRVGVYARRTRVHLCELQLPSSNVCEALVEPRYRKRERDSGNEIERRLRELRPSGMGAGDVADRDWSRFLAAIGFPVSPRGRDANESIRRDLVMSLLLSE